MKYINELKIYTEERKLDVNAASGWPLLKCSIKCLMWTRLINLHLKFLFFDIIFIVTLTPKGTLVVFHISPKYVFYQINIGPMSFSMYLW